MKKKLTPDQVGYLKSSIASGEFWLILVVIIILAIFQWMGFAPQEIVDRGGKVALEVKNWIMEALIIILPIFFALKRMALKFMQMWVTLQKYKIDNQL